MNKRCVLYSEEIGVYLGSCMGMGFWSKLDPAGQDSACCFDSSDEVKQFIQLCLEMDITVPKDARTVDVLTEHPDYATIQECVAAGLPGWDPNEKEAE